MVIQSRTQNCDIQQFRKLSEIASVVIVLSEQSLGHLENRLIALSQYWNDVASVRGPIRSRYTWWNQAVYDTTFPIAVVT